MAVGFALFYGKGEMASAELPPLKVSKFSTTTATGKGVRQSQRLLGRLREPTRQRWQVNRICTLGTSLGKHWRTMWPALDLGFSGIDAFDAVQIIRVSRAGDLKTWA